MEAKYKILEFIDSFNEEVKILNQLDEELLKEQELAKKSLIQEKSQIGNTAISFYNKMIEISYEIMIHNLKYMEYRTLFKKMVQLDEDKLKKFYELSLTTNDLLEKHKILMDNLQKMIEKESIPKSS